MKIVRVKWRDSHYLFDQHSLKAACDHGVAIFETVGHLIFEDSDRIVIAGDYLPLDEEVRCVTAIPKENIISKKVLRGV